MTLLAKDRVKYVEGGQASILENKLTIKDVFLFKC